MLGAGFVTKPTLQILSDAGVYTTVACRTLSSAESLCTGIANTNPVSLDVTNSAALEAALADQDVVISLIPYTFHAAVIRAAINTKTNVVTTSYVSPAMLELDAAAKEAGITVMNEIGLDPGIDHLYAVKTISEVHAAGGKITQFISFCGGLPAPENSDNPLGYKFSWSSRGVLLALRNTARVYSAGQIKEIDGPQLMSHAVPFDSSYPAFNFVGYPNRDSTPFRERYAIPEAQDLVRGTLRWAGFPEFVKTLVDVGFLSDDSHPALAKPIPWADATQAVLGASSPAPADLEAAVARKTSFKDAATQARILAGLRWIGLFSPTETIQPRGNPLDTLCATLETKMQFAPGERDFVFLQHRFGIAWADGRTETRTSTLVEYGQPTGPGSTSAMAKLVGVPCGVATLMVLKGEIAEKGVIAPVEPKLAELLATRLKDEYGIEMVEKTLL